MKTMKNILVVSIGTLLILVSATNVADGQEAPWFEMEVGGPNEEPMWVPSILEIAIDDLVIDYREVSDAPADFPEDAADVQQKGFRLYAPGTAHWGNANFTLAPGPDTDELYAWWAECSKGKDIRKNITVRLNKSDKTPGRSYNLLDCFPVAWVGSEQDPSGGALQQTETIYVHIGRIEFKTRVAGGNTGNGTGVSLSLEGQPAAEVDAAWESWSGGEPAQIQTGPFNNARFHTFSPGHKTVAEITLRGQAVDERKALCQWINDTVQGKPWKRMLTVTEMLSGDGSVRPGRKYTYFDCFPVRYVFPRMSVTNTTGNVMEELYIKPIRLELK